MGTDRFAADGAAQPRSSEFTTSVSTELDALHPATGGFFIRDLLTFLGLKYVESAGGRPRISQATRDLIERDLVRIDGKITHWIVKSDIQVCINSNIVKWKVLGECDADAHAKYYDTDIKPVLDQVKYAKACLKREIPKITACHDALARALQRYHHEPGTTDAMVLTTSARIAEHLQNMPGNADKDAATAAAIIAEGYHALLQVQLVGPLFSNLVAEHLQGSMQESEIEINKANNALSTLSALLSFTYSRLANQSSPSDAVDMLQAFPQPNYFSLKLSQKQQKQMFEESLQVVHRH